MSEPTVEEQLAQVRKSRTSRAVLGTRVLLDKAGHAKGVVVVDAAGVELGQLLATRIVVRWDVNRRIPEATIDLATVEVKAA